MSALRTIALCIALTMPQLAWAKSPDPRSIESMVSALVAQFSDGIAQSYPEFQHIILGNVSGTDLKDGVALFSIEGFGGGNYHAEYLAIFAAVPLDSLDERVTRPFRLVAVTQIGGRGWRTFDWKSAVIKPGRVTLKGKRWRKQDAACCASESIGVTFRLTNGSIVESH